LSGPIYTRPADYKGWKVPEVLTSGNFAKLINGWEDAYLTHTKNETSDLLKNKENSFKVVFQHLETLNKINFKL
jgi:tRNA (guanine37-N1)-methyltransferase